MKTLFTILLLICAAVAGVAYYAAHVPAASVVSLRTVETKRDSLLSMIGATGTVEPEEVVDVGARVMGLILEFGPDPKATTGFMDYGSVVEKGSVLAKIDPTPYQASLEEAEAALERAQADLGQLEAKALQTAAELARTEKLRAIRVPRADPNQPPIKGVSDSDYDLAVANDRVAKANLAVGKAAVRQAKAALSMARTNLGYTTITSPVRGVIVDRRVNVGQTVVASLNAPSLFLIAKDLRRMQVWASVNEADIGRIRVDMPVRFTVDAYPGETFRGRVSQIRLNATMTQNIVTYTVVVTTDNSSGRLLPYLTAGVQFEADNRSNVIVVPNAALRWKPQASQVDPAAGDPMTLATEVNRTPDQGRIWITSGNGLVRPLTVKVGTTDGTMTEISGADVKEGLPVVVGEQGPGAMAGDEAGEGEAAKNPFLPRPPKGARPPGPM